LPRRLGDLMALHPVPPQNEKDIRLVHVGLVVQVLAPMSAAAHPECTREFLRQGAVVILRTQPFHEPYAEGRLEMAALPAAAHIGERARAITADDAFQASRDFINSLIPGNPFKCVPDPFQGVFQAVGIVLVVCNVEPLAAAVAFASDIGLVRPNLDDAVVFHFRFEPAVLRAEDTAGLVNCTHETPFLFELV